LLALPAASTAATPCWKSVITDWSHDQHVDGRYSTACIRQAMQNAPTDLKIYSTLEDDLQAALQKRSARRLSGVHTSAAVVSPDGSSPLSPLVFVLAGLGGLVLLAGAFASIRKRRAGY
jgi:hypothetical protein